MFEKRAKYRGTNLQIYKFTNLQFCVSCVKQIKLMVTAIKLTKMWSKDTLIESPTVPSRHPMICSWSSYIWTADVLWYQPCPECLFVDQRQCRLWERGIFDIMLTVTIQGIRTIKAAIYLFETDNLHLLSIMGLFTWQEKNSAFGGCQKANYIPRGLNAVISVRVRQKQLNVRPPAIFVFIPFNRISQIESGLQGSRMFLSPRCEKC